MIPPKIRLITDDINFTEVVVYPVGDKTVRLVLHGEPFGQYGSEYSMVATLRDDQADLLIKAIQEIRDGRKIKTKKKRGQDTQNKD